MATKATYYLNAPTLAGATAVFTNAAMTTLATDGFYSASGITREQVGGLLLPPTVNTGACEFITTWTTDNAGTSASNQIQLPLVSTGVYDFIVDWGDGNQDRIVTWNQAETLHTYNLTGSYTVSIKGVITGWQFNGGGDCLKLTDILQWGCFNSGDTDYTFSGCENIELEDVTDTMDTTSVTTLKGFFANCKKLGGLTGVVANLGDWSVGLVNNFAAMFLNTYTPGTPVTIGFNTNINSWDMTGATSYTALNVLEGLHGMFKDANRFNQPLNNWDISNVKTINAIFRHNLSFNQDITMWDTSAVIDMENVCQGQSGFPSVFDYDISVWNIGAVDSLRGIFSYSGHTNAVYTSMIVVWANQVLDNLEIPRDVDMASQLGRIYTNASSGGAGFANAGLARTYLTSLYAPGTGAAWTIGGDIVV